MTRTKTPTPSVAETCAVNGACAARIDLPLWTSVSFVVCLRSANSWPSDLYAAGFPEQINDQQDHLWFDRMFVTNEGHHQIIGEVIDKQKAGKQESSTLAIANRQPQSCESKYGCQQEIVVARDHQIVSRDDGRLWRSYPEINGAFDCEPQESARMLTNKLPALLPLFCHEAEFTQFLELPHGIRVVAGMFVAGPQAC